VRYTDRPPSFEIAGKLYVVFAIVDIYLINFFYITIPLFTSIS